LRPILLLFISLLTIAGYSQGPGSDIDIGKFNKIEILKGSLSGELFKKPPKNHRYQKLNSPSLSWARSWRQFEKGGFVPMAPSMILWAEPIYHLSRSILGDTTSVSLANEFISLLA